MEKQIAQIMNAWVEDWNERRWDDLTKLYYAHADLLPADGSRASGQAEIRAFLEKQMGTKMEVHSPGFACFNNKDVPGVLLRTALTNRAVLESLSKGTTSWCCPICKWTLAGLNG